MIGFAVLALLLTICGVGVVRSANLVHSVFWLAAALIVTAALFITLNAAFMAMIQVILYTGGVITLMLFGVMLTQREPDTDIPNPLQRQSLAGVTSGVLFAVLSLAIWTTPDLAKTAMIDPGDATDIGRIFLGEQLLAFEVLSVLLLAGMIGAIVLARRKDP